MGLFKPDIKKMETKKDVKGLIKALKDKDAMIRRGAATALGGIGDREAVEPLVQALKDDKDMDVRSRATKALGETKDASAVEPLIQALRDKNGFVRRGAAEALGMIKDAKAVEPLIQTLGDESEFVQDSAIWALGEIKDARAIGPLIWNLKRPIKGIYVRGGPVKALASIGKPAVEPLAQALKDEEDAVARHRIAEALALIGKPALEPLTQALEDEDPYIRTIAKEALEKIKAEKAF